MRSIAFLLFVAMLLVYGCRTNNAGNSIRVRLALEPDKLNPLLTIQEQSTQICSKMFLSLMDYSPKTLQMVPVLAVSAPSQTKVDTGEMAGTTAWNYEIRPEAVWDNNKPVTAEDYVFSVKAIVNPNVSNGQIKSYVEHIKDIKVDAANPKKFTVYTRTYMLAENSCNAIPIMPAYAYDSAQLLRNIPLSQFCSSDTNVIKALAADPRVIKFAELFQSPDFTSNPKKITGCGPYKIVEWNREQRIVLRKKSKWWGDALASVNPILAAVPAQLEYLIVKDASTAINMLKGGQLDLVSKIPPAIFDELRNNDSTKTTLQYVTAPTPALAYIGINCARPTLSDVKVRRALAHLNNIQSIVADVMKGYAEPITGPFHPTKPYNNKALTPIEFSLEKATALLAESGWKDTDADGTLDKNIGGKKVPLKLTYLVASVSEPGKNIGLLLKENAAKVGINIEIQAVEGSLLMERLKKRDFDLYSLTFGQDLADDDPKQIWHTSSNTPTGGNRFGFGNAASDALIEKIRVTLDPAERAPLYIQFQQILYDAQPCIFLFTPKDRYIASTRFQMEATFKRPGYAESTFVVK